MSSNGNYVGRIAPSPTGLLHLGHARTFWLAYQRSLAANGTLLMRIDDLDPHRSRAEFADAALEDLAWLGIHWQQPVIYQSQRLSLYRDALAQLLAQGDAYPCSCSRRDLASAALAPHDEDDEPIYNGKCRPGKSRPESPDHISRASREPREASGHAAVSIRFRIPTEEKIAFTDLSLGPQSFTPQRDFGDFLLWSRDDVPSYQLATVVDDAALGVTEVVRGADLLRSTARQILLQRALGLPTPAWFHCPLVRDFAGRRLAKRHDALSLRALRASGRIPAELIAGFAAEPPNALNW